MAATASCSFDALLPQLQHFGQQALINGNVLPSPVYKIRKVNAVGALERAKFNFCAFHQFERYSTVTESPSVHTTFCPNRDDTSCGVSW